MQGAGSVAGGPRPPRAAKDGARISIADVDAARAQALADEVGGTVVARTTILVARMRHVEPQRARRDPQRRDDSRACNVPVVAGGANNQLATPADGDARRSSAASSTRPTT